MTDKISERVPSARLISPLAKGFKATVFDTVIRWFKSTKDCFFHSSNKGNRLEKEKL